MKFTRPIPAVMVFLSLAACIINLHLTAIHFEGSKSPNWFSEGCTPEDDPTYDCEQVVHTKWAVFPPSEADPVTGAQAGAPVAMLGWMYFTGIMVWYVLVGRVSYERRMWHYLLVLLVLFSCAVSAFFIYLLYTQMEIKCIWCIRAHIINFLILAGTILLCPRKPKDVGDTASAENDTEEDSEKAEPYPGVRLIIATFGCAFALAFAEYQITLRFAQSATILQAEKQLEAAKSEIELFRTDTATLLAMFEQQKPVKVNLRRDDPRRGEGKALLPIVVFSDFQCPACRAFAKDLEENVNPAFDNLLRIYWKHYPICTDCVPGLKRNLHPHACKAAYAAEAARLQQGNDGFWKTHDYLFANPKLFVNKDKEIDWGAVATALEMDVDRFLSDMQSEQVRKRVDEDVEEAKRLEVHSTPSIFLGNRPIRRYMFANKPFVEAIKKNFLHKRAAILKKYEQKTASQKNQSEEEDYSEDTESTPDNRDQSDAP